jgi:hypothetical protein
MSAPMTARPMGPAARPARRRMRKVRHWTPRYVGNRARLLLFEHSHPGLGHSDIRQILTRPWG